MVGIKVFDCAGILEKIFLEDKNQDKDKRKEKYQVKDKNNDQVEEISTENQDLPKKSRDLPIQNVIGDILRRQPLDTILT